MDIKMEEFSTIWKSIRTLFILLNIGNFPDVPIKIMAQTTSTLNRLIVIIFFTSFLLINVFILLGLLFALYYSNYMKIDKMMAIEFLRLLKYILVANFYITDHYNTMTEY